MEILIFESIVTLTIRNDHTMSRRKDPELCCVLECKKEHEAGEKTCPEHTEFFARIRGEIEEDPMLIYNQRSDNPNRQLIDPTTGKRRKARGKVLPVCCVPGCFELRVPPDAYCYEHQGFAGGD